MNFVVLVVTSPKAWVDAYSKALSNKIYDCAFMYYSMFSPMQATFLSTHGNGKVTVLEKLSYIQIMNMGLKILVLKLCEPGMNMNLCIENLYALAADDTVRCKVP